MSNYIAEITLHCSCLIYICWRASEIKTTQHCMLRITKSGSNVSQSNRITSQTTESWLHTFAYNWCALDLINSLVACFSFGALIFMQKGARESMRSLISFSALPLLYIAANTWGIECGCTTLITRAISGFKIYSFFFSQKSSWIEKHWDIIWFNLTASI